MALVRETLRIEGLVLFGFRVRVGVLFWFGSGGPWAWLFGWSNLAGTPSAGSKSLPGRRMGVPLPPPPPRNPGVSDGADIGGTKLGH